MKSLLAVSLLPLTSSSTVAPVFWNVPPHANLTCIRPSHNTSLSKIVVPDPQRPVDVNYAQGGIVLTLGVCEDCNVLAPDYCDCVTLNGTACEATIGSSDCPGANHSDACVVSMNELSVLDQCEGGCYLFGEAGAWTGCCGNECGSASGLVCTDYDRLLDPPPPTTEPSSEPSLAPSLAPTRFSDEPTTSQPTTLGRKVPIPPTVAPTEIASSKACSTWNAWVGLTMTLLVGAFS